MKNNQEIIKNIFSLGLAIGAIEYAWLDLIEPSINLVTEVLHYLQRDKTNLNKIKKEIEKQFKECVQETLECLRKEIDTDTLKKMAYYLDDYLRNKNLDIKTITSREVEAIVLENIEDNGWKEWYSTNQEVLYLQEEFIRIFKLVITKYPEFADFYSISQLDILKDKVDTLMELEDRIKEIENNSKTKFDLNAYIKKQKEIVKNQVIFPWFCDSPKYKEVFPKLFVDPELKGRMKHYTFTELLCSGDKQFVILGEAGAGKSTLLRFVFAFDKLEDVTSIYITANEIKSNNNKIFDILTNAIEQNNSKKRFVLFIDGIDEAYYNDFFAYQEFIIKLKQYIKCRFWIACRTDYHHRFQSENTIFEDEVITIQPWEKGQWDYFIQQYSEIVNCPELSLRIDNLINKEEETIKFKKNPFYLALLAFLAENKEEGHIHGIYDLYEKFVQRWLEREQKRGTCKNSKYEIICTLEKIAEQIYIGKVVYIDSICANNTAIKDLLKIEYEDMLLDAYATEFYHRSLSAFFIARSIIQAMLGKKELCKLGELLNLDLKDDVTNFVNDKCNNLNENEKNIVKENLIQLYDIVGDSISIKEQIIYFITRLDIEVSDFLIQIINTNPKHPIMRMTLAYGCVLSNSNEVREYALNYAKSIAKESIDAITNRAWTVIYFGDVIRNPYTYQDNEKCSWKNARNARIKRFIKSSPRLKDYRFRLFDIPLFHSFLKDRNWNDVSQEEFEILSKIDIPSSVFNKKEQEFLIEQKELLLKEYAKYLGSVD